MPMDRHFSQKWEVQGVKERFQEQVRNKSIFEGRVGRMCERASAERANCVNVKSCEEVVPGDLKLSLSM